MNAATTDTRLDIAAVVARAGALLAIDGWSRERLRELQQERLRALLAHAVERSPFYRDRLGPDAVEAELGDLPTLSKPALVEEHDRIVTDPSLRADDLRLFLAESGAGSSFSDGYRVFATSGSTGIPGLFVYAADEFAHWIAVGLARLARVGVTGDTRLVAIGAPADVHITRQLFAAFQAGRQDVPRLSATTPLGEMTAALDAYRPEAVIGYASVLALLAQEQLEGRLSIRPRIAMATSEVLTDETVGWVEEAWGSPPLNVYAATEAPGIAMASLSGSACMSARNRSSSRWSTTTTVPCPTECRARKSCSRTSSTARSRSSATSSRTRWSWPRGRTRAAGRSAASSEWTGAVTTSSTSPAVMGARCPCTRTGSARRSPPSSTSVSTRSSTNRTVP